MKQNNKQNKYIRAKHRVDRLRGFYTHAVVYILINLGISTYKIIRNLTHGESFNEALFDFSTFIPWGLWGIGLGLHAFYVFGLPKLLGNNWEEEKIKEFMKDEETTRF
jgi:hypothetical protein